MAQQIPQALLTDFGGVLTSNVFDSFRAFSARELGDPLRLERLFRENGDVAAALVEHECGRLPQAGFEKVLAEALGPDVEAGGLVDAISADMRPDERMIAAVTDLRARGVPVALVSNSLGDDCYRGVDLAALCDVRVISAEVGTRKPGRQIYRIACERLGVAPGRCVLVDDLPHNLAGAARLGIGGLHHTDTGETVRALDRLFGAAG